MLVYRIARQKWITNFQGSSAPSRWNKAGSLMIYTASSLALALLECLVHIKRDQIPSDYMWISGEVPKEKILQPGFPASYEPAEFGTAWLNSAKSVALFVPSVIVPELNVLLNPDHSDFACIRWGAQRPYKLTRACWEFLQMIERRGT